ncbi:MAG: hypothetical protein ACJ761_09570 [Chloroflexota bacterium]
MRPSTRLLRAPLVLAGAVVLSLVGASVGSADTTVVHSGAFGRHYLADTGEYPGAFCTYNNNQVINSIRVRDPFVFARNRTSGVDTQMVGWFFRIQTHTSSGWTTVATSTIQKRSASDADVANFGPITKTFTGNSGKTYRVLVTMRWYNTAGLITGQAIHRVDFYSWEIAPSFEGYCPGGIL